MILLDSSVVLDARDGDSPFHEWAKNQIAEAVAGPGAAVNTVVLSEACVRAINRDAVPALLTNMGIVLIALPISAAVTAARAFAVDLSRLKKEGKSTSAKAPLPDFLIGAHAEAENLTLLTRDPGRVRTYFPNVKLIVPESMR